MSALRAAKMRDHAKQGLLLEQRHGAGDEDTGGDFSGGRRKRSRGVCSWIFRPGYQHLRNISGVRWMKVALPLALVGCRVLMVGATLTGRGSTCSGGWHWQNPAFALWRIAGSAAHVALGGWYCFLRNTERSQVWHAGCRRTHSASSSSRSLSRFALGWAPDRFSPCARPLSSLSSPSRISDSLASAPFLIPSPLRPASSFATIWRHDLPPRTTR
jgi:hypothetical protein